MGNPCTRHLLREHPALRRLEARRRRAWQAWLPDDAIPVSAGMKMQEQREARNTDTTISRTVARGARIQEVRRGSSSSPRASPSPDAERTTRKTIVNLTGRDVDCTSDVTVFVVFPLADIKKKIVRIVEHLDDIREREGHYFRCAPPSLGFRLGECFLYRQFPRCEGNHATGKRRQRKEKKKIFQEFFHFRLEIYPPIYFTSVNAKKN